MLDTIKTMPIKIEILDISPKNKAVLEFFFKHSGKSLFKKSNQDNADAFIIDYDFPGAKESWKKVFDATQKPAIVFSFKKVDLPYTISVGKPITAKALTKAGAELKEMMALKQSTLLEATEQETKQEETSLVGETQPHGELAFAGSDDFADAVEIEAEAIEDETATGGINTISTEESVSLKTDTNESHFPQIDAELADHHEEEATFNSFDLDAISHEQIQPKADSSEGLETNLTDGKDEEEPSIESLLDELSSELPEVDKILDGTSPELNDTPDKTIPVVENPVATAPQIMLEEDDLETTISSDDEIEALLQSIQQRTDKKEEQLRSIEEKAKKATPAKPTRELTKAEKRWKLLCGDIDDIADADEIKKMYSGGSNSLLTTKVRNISYNTKSHMFSYFLLAIKQAKRHLQVIEMRYLNRTMVIDHALNCVYCDRTIYSDSFAKFCSQPSNQAELTMRIIKDEDEIRQYRKIIGLALDTTYSMESFIWTASMLTSRGRLPQQININDKIKLKHWPDLTRVEQIPHAVRIAAVFYKHPGNLLEVANWLHIPQRYVFAFYNAVLALEMIEVQKVEIAKKPEPSFFEVEDTTEKTETRGLFSRLLTKLGA